MFILYVDGTDANCHQNLLTSDAEVQTVDTLHRTQKTAVLSTNPVFFTYTTLEENARRADFLFLFQFRKLVGSVNCRGNVRITLDTHFMGRFWKPNTM